MMKVFASISKGLEYIKQAQKIFKLINFANKVLTFIGEEYEKDFAEEIKTGSNGN